MKVDVELPVLRRIKSPAIPGADYLPVVHYIRYGVYQLGKLLLGGNIAFLEIAFQRLSVPYSLSYYEVSSDFCFLDTVVRRKRFNLFYIW